MYVIARGDGRDVIADTSGAADRLQYGGTISSYELILSRQADNLRLAMQGSREAVTIQDWFRVPAAQIETIQAGDGQILLHTQVMQLIQAMGQFTVETGLIWEQAAAGQGTADQQAQFQGILAANWQ
jgi:hypothetical protein